MTTNTVYVGTLGSGAKSGILSPVVQGSTESLHTITVKYADDSTAYNLTGKTITATWYLQMAESTIYSVTGTLAVTDAANGIFTWDKSAADVGTTGRAWVQFIITDDGDSETDATFRASMLIKARQDATAVAAAALVGLAVAIKDWLTLVYNSIGAITGSSQDNVMTFDANGIPQDSGVDIATLGTGTLDSFTDVTITGTPADNEVLAYDTGSAEWINQTAAEAALATAADLTTHEGDTTNPHSVTAAQADALPEDAVINAQSTTYEVVAGDAGKIIECNGTFTVTLPDGLDAGFQATIINVGTGTITLAAATTLNGEGTLLETQWTGAVVYHRGSNVWVAMGKLTS